MYVASACSYAYDIVLNVQQINITTWDFTIILENNSIDYTAFQMDMNLMGTELRLTNLKKGSLIEHHILTGGNPDINHYRIVGYSIDNEIFPQQEGILFSFRLTGDFDEICISDVLFSEKNATVFPSKNESYKTDKNITNNISSTTKDFHSLDHFQVYNTAGQRINMEQDGIYIVNGKKIYYRNR